MADVAGHQRDLVGHQKGTVFGHGGAVVQDDMGISGAGFLQVHGGGVYPCNAGIDEQSADAVPNAHQVQRLGDHLHLRPLAQLSECARDMVAGVQDANQRSKGLWIGAGEALCQAKLVE